MANENVVPIRRKKSAALDIKNPIVIGAVAVAVLAIVYYYLNKKNGGPLLAKTPAPEPTERGGGFNMASIPGARTE